MRAQGGGGSAQLANMCRVSLDWMREVAEVCVRYITTIEKISKIRIQGKSELYAMW